MAGKGDHPRFKNLHRQKGKDIAMKMGDIDGRGHLCEPEKADGQD